MASKINFKLPTAVKREMALMKSSAVKTTYKKMMIDAEKSLHAFRNRRASDRDSAGTSE
jgi:hypothetical protein